MFILVSLLALVITHPTPIDRNASSFSTQEKKKGEVYDFSGSFPHLQTIDIDAKKKLHSQLLINGDYPELEKVVFLGGIGTTIAEITGSFPKLEEISFSNYDADLDLNLCAPWTRSCTIHLKSVEGKITLTLPKDQPLCVHVKKGVKGITEPVLNQHPTLKKKKNRVLSAQYLNFNPKTDVPLLDIWIELEKGQLVLK